MIIIVLNIAFFFAAVWFLEQMKQDSTRGEHALEATNNLCDLRDELIKWCDSEKPRRGEEFAKLVQANIGAYLIFLDTHPYIKDREERLEPLRSLLVK